MALALPNGIEREELLLNALNAVMTGDIVYYAEGSIEGEEELWILDMATLLTSTVDSIMELLGELAEKPGKTDSKVEKLKTRNYTLPGKRISTVELTICGLSSLQKSYLESGAFSGKPITIMLAPKNLMELDYEVDSAAIVLFVGLCWTVDWSGEADGLWNVVISTEYSGATSGRIYPVVVPPYTEREGEGEGE